MFAKCFAQETAIQLHTAYPQKGRQFVHLFIDKWWCTPVIILLRRMSLGLLACCIITSCCSPATYICTRALSHVKNCMNTPILLDGNNSQVYNAPVSAHATSIAVAFWCIAATGATRDHENNAFSGGGQLVRGAPAVYEKNICVQRSANEAPANGGVACAISQFKSSTSPPVGLSSSTFSHIVLLKKSQYSRTRPP